MQYKWKNPTSKLEADERMTIVEDNGDRVIVTSSYCKNMPIQPTQLVMRYQIEPDTLTATN